MEPGLGLVISTVRYITGYLKTKNIMNPHIDSTTRNTVNTSIDTHINKTVLSTALKVRHLIFGDTNKCLAASDAKTIIDLFYHAARIPITEQEKLESACVGILRIISSLSMISKNKKPTHIKGDPKTTIKDIADV